MKGSLTASAWQHNYAVVVEQRQGAVRGAPNLLSSTFHIVDLLSLVCLCCVPRVYNPVHYG